jgi:hypothetical protein
MVRLPDDPEATAHLRRQLATISEFADLKARCRIPPDPGSELANLSAALPDAPVSIEESLAVGVECAYGAVGHLAHLLDKEASFAPIVLSSLLRTALLGAGRTVYAIGPDDPDARFSNSLVVLRQESNSLLQGIESFSAFIQLGALVPPQYVSSAWTQLNQEVNSIGRPMGERRTLTAMATVIAQELTLNGYIGPNAQELLAEEVEWVWHAYSGVAHAFAWPRRLPSYSGPSVTPMPGDFYAEFGFVVSITHLALKKTAERSHATTE